MIATAIVSLSLVPAPHPSLQPAQIRSTTTPSIAPTLLFYVFVATDAEYGAVDATRVFADDRVGASDFIIGQELA